MQVKLHLHESGSSEYIYFRADVEVDAVGRKPRELIVLVDDSYSMDGARGTACRQAAKWLLRQLQPDERFLLGVFGRSLEWIKSPGAGGPELEQSAGETAAPEFAESAAIDRAAAALADLERAGQSGTNLEYALQCALAAPISRGEYSRHIVVFTDGEVLNEKSLLTTVHEAQRHEKRRISLVCVGADTDAYLPRELARRNGGRAAYFEDSGDSVATVAEMLHQSKEWVPPPAMDLRLEARAQNVQSSVQTPGADTAPGTERVGPPIEEATGAFITSGSGWSVLDMGLVAPGSIQVVGRTAARPGLRLEMRIVSVNGDILAETAADLDGATSGQPDIKRLFGEQRLRALETLSARPLDISGDIQRLILRNDRLQKIASLVATLAPPCPAPPESTGMPRYTGAHVIDHARKVEKDYRRGMLSSDERYHKYAEMFSNALLVTADIVDLIKAGAGDMWIEYEWDRLAVSACRVCQLHYSLPVNSLLARIRWFANNRPYHLRITLRDLARKAALFATLQTACPMPGDEVAELSRTLTVLGYEEEGRTVERLVDRPAEARDAAYRTVDAILKRELREFAAVLPRKDQLAQSPGSVRQAEGDCEIPGYLPPGLWRGVPTPYAFSDDLKDFPLQAAWAKRLGELRGRRCEPWQSDLPIRKVDLPVSGVPGQTSLVERQEVYSDVTTPCAPSNAEACSHTIFQGRPIFKGCVALLIHDLWLDNAPFRDTKSNAIVLTCLDVRLVESCEFDRLDSDLCVMVRVGPDPWACFADKAYRVFPLRDLLLASGQCTLDIVLGPDEELVVQLVDPNGAMLSDCPRMELTLTWHSATDR